MRDRANKLFKGNIYYANKTPLLDKSFLTQLIDPLPRQNGIKTNKKRCLQAKDNRSYTMHNCYERPVVHSTDRQLDVLFFNALKGRPL